MIDPDALDVLHKTIHHDYSDTRWLTLLETLEVTGVANSLQLRAASGLERDALNRLIIKLNQQAGKLPPVLVELDHTLPRLNQRGRAPNVYLLGDTGAALLRLEDHHGATASGLKQDTPIAHALDMLDVHLAAREAGLTVTTDGVIEFGDGQVIRPDHLIDPAVGLRYLIENEQTAGPDLLRRMRDSVQHRADFFTSTAGREVQPIVRMLISLPRGKVFERTLHYWDQAIRSVFTKYPQPPYRLLAMPLAEFLAQPNWSVDPLCDDQRWIELTPVQEQQTTKLARPSNKPVFASTAVIQKAPRDWLHTSPHDDLLLLEALWQDFNERASVELADIPDPDPEFFALMRLIYAASHDPALSALDRAGFPRASVYLLRRYLQIHPKLREALIGAMKRGSSASRWNVTLIKQWMQAVIDQFLKYHGFASGQTLLARVVLADWKDENTVHAIDVEVYLASGEMLMPREASGIVPGRDEVAQAARALKWVLHALFAHAEPIGLGKPPAFW